MGLKHLLDQLSEPAVFLNNCIRRNLGVRIGQSTVFSQKVHTMEPGTPETVTIMQNADAGQVFYHRGQSGQIYHFDVFHECGPVEHRLAAKAIAGAIEQYILDDSVRGGIFLRSQSSLIKPDWFDVQTSTGGGRVTGSLAYGKKMSLRRAHENHVHVAGMIPGESLACAFYIVQAVEAVIISCGLELRANEFLRHADGSEANADLSPYADQSDSFLQEKNIDHEPAALRRQRFMQDAAELAEELDGAKEVYEILSGIAAGDVKEKSVSDSLAGQEEFVFQRLSGMGIVKLRGDTPLLTAYGQELKAFLAQRLPDVESYIRRIYRLFKPYDSRSGHTRTQSKSQTGIGGTGRRIVGTGIENAEIALPDTVQAAACRCAANPSQPLRILPSDVQHYRRLPKRKTELCILLDASASMAGSRIQAAKYLVRHLLLSTPDRICVILFQEDRATVQVPFTRDYFTVQKSLKGLQAVGSTPLGLGITACLRYLESVRPTNPLIVLVTDGVPTFADVTNDPVADALAAAAGIKEKGYGFACIGLRPHRDYLYKLAHAAGGSIYMLDELEKQALARTAWHEHRVRQ